MVENNTQQGSSPSPHDLRRRRLLQFAALGGGALLAGCGGNSGPSGEGTPTDDAGTRTTDGSGTQHVDQVFRLPTADNPQEEHWFYADTWGFADHEFFTYEYGIWGEWNIESNHGFGELNYRQFEEVVTEDDRVEITVRDDANWSNGNPVTGRDAIVGSIRQRIHGGAMTFEEVEQSGPSLAWDAITDFDYDGKTAVLHSDGGYFGDLLDQNIWRRLLLELGPRYDTTIEPYEEYADRLFEVMEMAANGEVDPWNASGPTLRNEIQDDVFGEDTEPWREHFRKPENVHTNGAWTLGEVQGQQAFVLVPNEHHRHRDQINFDRVVLEYQTEQSAIWASVHNTRYDLASGNPPSHVAEGFPGAYTQHLVPSNDGISIATNHAHPVLGNVGARQAIMTAIDTEAITETLSPTTFDPVQVPGGDVYGAGHIEDGWAEENLTSYAYDADRASELMSEAGYERNSDGTWTASNGDPAEITLSTPATAPQMEPIIVQQLNDFGVNTEMQPLEETLFESEMAAGDLDMWIDNGGTGFAYSAARVYEAAWLYREGMRARSWFEGSVEENLENTSYAEDGLALEQNPDALRHLVVRAPPIGQPDGELQEYDVASLARFHNSPPEELAETYPKLLWVLNWHLPTFPITNTQSQFFVNTRNWHWPTDQPVWDLVGISSRLSHQDLLSWGDHVSANPDDPKS